LVPANFTYDSTADIKLTKYDNDAMKYESNASSPQIAVLSEIYYPAGWNLYIDGKKTDYFKTNYVLRGMVIPQGKHDIEFKLEPQSYRAGYAVAKWTNILMVLILLAAVGFEFKARRKKTTAA
jgi:uncharacterized membrane protein YfhO